MKKKIKDPERKSGYCGARTAEETKPFATIRNWPKLVKTPRHKLQIKVPDAWQAKADEQHKAHPYAEKNYAKWNAQMDAAFIMLTETAVEMRRAVRYTPFPN